jgi:hypothetical protein
MDWTLKTPRGSACPIAVGKDLGDTEPGSDPGGSAAARAELTRLAR